MNRIQALVGAALIGVSAAAAADGVHHGKKGAATARKEAKEWGIASDAFAARRTIEIAMTDNMRFTPERIDVRQGETVRLVVRNTGKVMHELVLGTKKSLDEHAALMARFPKMEHDEPYMTHVAPGKAGEIVWTFTQPGEFDFACLVAGHYQAGMVGKVKVAAVVAKP